MKSAKNILTIMTLLALLLMTTMAASQSDQTSPPLSQPLVREGALAVKLADAFKLGSLANETEAESALSDKGIAPRNGWIADYPVTPDIAGELQVAVADSAEARDIPVDKDTALKTFSDVMADFNLPVATEGLAEGEGSEAPAYPDAGAQDEYYDSEGPPVVTYYTPPADYAYMYDWVPSPFWWGGIWFPGFFVLVDFDVRVHRHGHKRGNGHDEMISNHFKDTNTGRAVTIDPVNRTPAPIASGTKSAPSIGTNTHVGGTSRSTCSSCHYSAPSGGSRSSGIFRGSSRGSFGGHVGGSFGGGWRR